MKCLLISFAGSMFAACLLCIPVLAQSALEITARAIAEAGEGKVAEALADYARAIELDPKLVIAYYNRSLVYNIQKDYAKSLEDLNKTLELVPDHRRALLNRGRVYRETRKYDLALADFTKLTELMPED